MEEFECIESSVVINIKFVYVGLLIYAIFGQVFVVEYTQLYGCLAGDKDPIICLAIWLGIYLIIAIFYCCFSFTKWYMTAVVILASYGLLFLIVDEKLGQVLWICAAGATTYVIWQVVKVFARKEGEGPLNILRFLVWLSIRYVTLIALLVTLSSIFIGVKDNVLAVIKIQRQKSYIQQVVEVDKKIFRNNEKVLENFTEEKWKTLSQEQREKACLQLAQLELLYLVGEKDETLSFYIGNDYIQSAGGYFSVSSNRIVLDQEYQDDVSYVLNAVLHESYHYFQHRLVDVGKKVDIRNLVTKSRIEEYRKNMQMYQGIWNYDEYYSQIIEVDARAYAEKAAKQYEAYISKMQGRDEVGK